jgi:hypothetical protein
MKKKLIKHIKIVLRGLLFSAPWLNNTVPGVLLYWYLSIIVQTTVLRSQSRELRTEIKWPKLRIAAPAPAPGPAPTLVHCQRLLEKP